jgi:ankyrin repeat protein
MDDQGFLNYQNGNLPVAAAVPAEPAYLEDDQDERLGVPLRGGPARLGEGINQPSQQQEQQEQQEQEHEQQLSGVAWSPILAAVVVPDAAMATVAAVEEQAHGPIQGGEHENARALVGHAEGEDGDGRLYSSDRRRNNHSEAHDVAPPQQGRPAAVAEEVEGTGVLPARRWPLLVREQGQLARGPEALRQPDRADPGDDRRGGGGGVDRGRHNRFLLRMRRRMGRRGDFDDFEDEAGANNANNDDDDREGGHGWMAEDEVDEEEFLAMVDAHAVDEDPRLNNLDPRNWIRFGGAGWRRRLADNVPADDDGDAGDDLPAPPEPAPAPGFDFDFDDNHDEANNTTRGLDSVSSYLFDLIREARTCTSILSGWNPRSRGCNTVVEHCTNNPEQAFFVSIHRRTAVHEACLRGACRHVVRALLAANQLGAMDRDDQGNTALHLLFVDFSSPHRGSSVLSPQEMDQVVGDLLAINPSMMASGTNVEGNTALHIACVAPEAMIDPNSIVQLLNANSGLARRVNNKNQTPLRLHCQRRNASTHVARLLLEANPDALRTLDYIDGWAPIHYAAANANLNLIQYLVEAYPESVRVRTTKNQTALHLLCQQHHNLLEAASSTPPSKISRNCNRPGSHTPQVAAALSLLLEADPTAVVERDMPHSCTPLHLVCKAGGSRPEVSVQVVRQLLRFNPHAATIADDESYLPLHHASEVGCGVEMMDVLLDANPAAAMAMTRKHDSALSLACTSNKSVDAVLRLIQANPKALTTKNDYGFAPLHCVCRAYQPRMGIVQALIEADPECVRLQTNAGETPVHLASSNSSAFVGVLQLLTATSIQQRRCFPAASIGASTSDDGAGLHRIEDADTALMAQGEKIHQEDDSPAADLLHQPLHRHRTPTHRRRGETLNTNSNHGNTLTNKMGNTPRKCNELAALIDDPRDIAFRYSPISYIV